MPTALEISILETLHLLDGAFRESAEEVAEDRYAVWLGAGISLGKLPGLEELAEAVLEHLRVRVDLLIADCRWRVIAVCAARLHPGGGAMMTRAQAADAIRSSAGQCWCEFTEPTAPGASCASRRGGSARSTPMTGVICSICIGWVSQ
jgi:hypothetical protein